VEAGFTEPYLFGRNLALGFDLFRRDYNANNGLNNGSRSAYSQTTTGGQLRVGFAITEFWAASVRYGLTFDNVTIDPAIYYSQLPDPKDLTKTTLQCDPLLAGRFLCESLGKYTTSSVGYSLIYNSANSPVRPSRGQRFVFSQDLAGVGLGVKYLRTRVNYDWYHPLFGDSSGFVLNVGGEGGYIFGYGGSPVRLTDRFFLGEGQLRGFGIRGVGPRVVRKPLVNGVASTDKATFTDDSIGGEAYYRGRIEVQIPLGAAGAELGLRPSIFTDIGAVFKVPNPGLIDGSKQASPFEESFVGNSPKPRLSVGAGVSWNSPFGPFRFDLAKALLKQPGDQPKLFQFNVGTQF